MNQIKSKKTSLKLVEILLFLLLLSGVFLGHVPSFKEPFIYLFFIFFLIFVIFAFYSIKKNIPIDKISLTILVLVLFILPINFIVAYQNGVSPILWLRSALWVIILILYPCFIILSKYLSKQKTFDFVILACFIWSISLLLLNSVSVLSLLTGESNRLSHDTRQVFVPIALIGYTLLLFGINKFKFHHYIYLVLFFVIILMAGYRSQFLLSFIFLFIKMKPWKKLSGLLSMLILSLIAIVLHAIFQFSFVNTMLVRFENIDDNKPSRRSREIDFASQIFKKYYILGKGFGFQVPAHAVRDKAVDIYSKGGTLTYSLNDGINYIHNFTFYVLMCMGLSGYIFVIFLSIFVILNSRTIGNNSIRYGALMTIIALVIYFHISASFKQPQTMAILATLLFLLSPIGYNSELHKNL